MQLSKHFKLKEFTKSQIAARNGINNTPHSGDTYIYAAFAEAPFVNSNGVPCNAR